MSSPGPAPHLRRGQPGGRGAHSGWATQRVEDRAGMGSSGFVSRAFPVGSRPHVQPLKCTLSTRVSPGANEKACPWGELLSCPQRGNQALPWGDWKPAGLCSPHCLLRESPPTLPAEKLVVSGFSSFRQRRCRPSCSWGLAGGTSPCS